jgi:hypothetical protein
MPMAITVLPMVTAMVGHSIEGLEDSKGLTSQDGG